MTIQSKLETLSTTFNNDIDLELHNYYQDGQSANEFLEAVKKGISQEKIIYCYKAIAYLSKHDQSLSRSLEIASSLNYDVEELSSDILATLLYQESLLEHLENIEVDILDIFVNEYLTN